MSGFTDIDFDKEFSGIVSVNRFGDEPTSVRLDGPTSVAQCLARAGIETPLPSGQSVSVDGNIVRDLSTPVEPGAVVVVAGNISNG